MQRVVTAVRGRMGENIKGWFLICEGTLNETRERRSGYPVLY